MRIVVEKQCVGDTHDANGAYIGQCAQMAGTSINVELTNKNRIRVISVFDFAKPPDGWHANHIDGSWLCPLHNPDVKG